MDINYLTLLLLLVLLNCSKVTAQLVPTTVFTVQHSATARRMRGDQPPIVASLANSDSYIQVIRIKPKVSTADHQVQPNTVVTPQIVSSLDSLSVQDDKITVSWSLIVTPGHRRRRRQTTQEPGQLFQWSIRIRQFANTSVRGHRIRDEMTEVKNKSYTYSIRGLTSDTAYIVCIASNTSTMVDSLATLHIASQDNYHRCSSNTTATSLCKELQTLKSNHQLDKSSNNSKASKLISSDMAIASAVSSASTLIVVFLFCCCCSSKKSAATDSLKRTNSNYLRFSKSSTSSDGQVTSNSASSTGQSATCYRPSKDAADYFIDPNDIASIGAHNRRVFTRPRVTRTASLNYHLNYGLVSGTSERPRPQSWSYANDTISDSSNGHSPRTSTII